MTDVHIDVEAMSHAFTKFHLRGLGCAAVIHRFTEPDHGDWHDHPWGFTSFVISGGYVEEVFLPNGYTYLAPRKPGTSFQIRATHIHRIIELPEGQCETLILPGPWERKSRFWRFENGKAISRAWDEPWPGEDRETAE